jgi:WD40 repeat protein
MSVAPVPSSPYQGLTPYSEEDARFFFGRDPEREIITANLLASRLTLLYGESGVGKSSVLRAGVAYRLRRLADANIAERGRPELGVVVFSSWRDDPVAGLFRSIEDSLRLSQPDGADDLGPPPDSLEEVLQRAARRVGGEMLVILDQFEEYFLYHPQDLGPGSFAAEFARAVCSPSLAASFLVSIREDSVTQLDRFKGRIPHLFDNYYRIEHLSRDAAREAIDRPVTEYNKLSGEDPIEIERELVEAVLDEVAVREDATEVSFSGPGSPVRASDESDDRVETPYLQLVMTHVWNEEVGGGSRQLRLATLKRLGKGREILRRHLDEAMDALTSRERDLAFEVFHYLVTPSGTKIAHSVSDLSEYARVDERRLGSLLKRLTAQDTRILRSFRTIDDEAKVRYEIFHDLLARGILEWRRRYASRRARRRAARVGAVLVGVLGVVAAGAIAYAYQQRELAVEERTAAVASARTSAIATPNLKALLLGHQGPVRRAEFSHDGKLVVSAGDDGTVRVWRAGSGKRIETLRGRGGAVRGVVFGAMGDRVVTGADDGHVRVWSVPAGKLLADLTGHGARVNSVAVGPFGHRIVSASDDGTARVWASDGDGHWHLSVVLPAHGKSIASAVFDPGGRRVLTAGADGTARIWNAASGSERAVLRGHGGSVTRAGFSGDGRHVVTAGSDGTARIWDASGGRARFVLRGHDGPVNGAAFSNDGRLVVTAGSDGTARVWDARTGKQLSVLKGHSAGLTRAVFGQGARIVATGSDDGSARIWRSTGESIQILSGHKGAVLSVKLDPDGRTAVTAGEDGTVRTWKVPAEPLRRSRVLGRSVERRSIRLVRIGNSLVRPKVLVVGCIHGNECAGVEIARRIIEEKPPLGTSLWVIVNLNPDGFVADIRQNAHRVDLNRNFPFKWTPSKIGSNEYSGPRVLSEPEARIAYDLIRELRPELTIWFHTRSQPAPKRLPLIDQAGGDVALERRYATLVRLPLVRRPRFPGSVASWQNTAFLATTAMVVELPFGSKLPPDQVQLHTKAVLDLARLVAGAASASANP